MAYTLTHTIVLASSQVGLTLSVQLIDTAGVNVGSPISGAVVELGSGQYLASYSVPDGHRGGAKFFSGVTFKASVGIAPEDIELIDTLNTNMVITRDAALEILTLPTAPTVAEIDSRLSDTHGAGAWDGGATDPLEAIVPGTYEPGTAGYQLGLLSGDLVLTSSAPVVTESGDVELVKGQDYKEENGNSITFTSTTWPVLGNASIWLEVGFTDEPIDMDVVQQGAATQIVRLNLDDQTTADLPLNRYQYAVFAQLSGGNTFVLAKGRLLFT